MDIWSYIMSLSTGKWELSIYVCMCSYSNPHPVHEFSLTWHFSVVSTNKSIGPLFFEKQISISMIPELCKKLKKKKCRAVRFNWKGRRVPFEERLLIFHNWSRALYQEIFSESVRVAHKLEVGTCRLPCEIRLGEMQRKNKL